MLKVTIRQPACFHAPPPNRAVRLSVAHAKPSDQRNQLLKNSLCTRLISLTRENCYISQHLPTPAPSTCCATQHWLCLSAVSLQRPRTTNSRGPMFLVRVPATFLRRPFPARLGFHVERRARVQTLNVRESMSDVEKPSALQPSVLPASAFSSSAFQPSAFPFSVSFSQRPNVSNASSRVAPHIKGSGRKLTHTAGRSGRPNSRQLSCSSSCTHGIPAGLPHGMPGMGVLIDGAIQHAAQPGRQA